MSNLPNIYSIIQNICREKSTSITQLSKDLGYSANHLNAILPKGNPKPSILIGLSNILEVNLLEPYMAQLKEEARSTSTERQLRYQLEQKEKELEQVKAERDKYWDAIKGRLG